MAALRAVVHICRAAGISQLTPGPPPKDGLLHCDLEEANPCHEDAESPTGPAALIAAKLDSAMPRSL